ncbi:hypothetical protein JCM11491_003290 [Sporobolomyces phaffii]
MPPVPQFQLSGSPTEVGFQHGQLAATQIQHSLDLYSAYFREQAGLDWGQVRNLAHDFATHIAQDHDDLLDEIKGIAQGAGQDWIDIVALNVRTEASREPAATSDSRPAADMRSHESQIGLASPNAETLTPIDGCTAFSLRDSKGTLWSAQNWDWKSSAASSLISLDILAHAPTKRPRIRLMTEAGVIGKIGVNEHGVAILLNALKRPLATRSVDGPQTNLRDPARIPIHLLLRRLISLSSVAACVSYLASPPISNRCASAAHVLVTDPTESISVEILPTGTFARTLTRESGAAAVREGGNVPSPSSPPFLSHTNHLRYTSEPTETHLWPDSFPRLTTLDAMLVASCASPSSSERPDDDATTMSFDKVRTILSDRTLGEKGICRFEAAERGDIVTVFSIGIKSRPSDCEGDTTRAEVVVGRPDEGGQVIEWTFP